MYPFVLFLSTLFLYIFRYGFLITKLPNCVDKVPLGPKLSSP